MDPSSLMAQLVAMTNNHVKTKLSPEKVKEYDDACTIIANDLSCSTPNRIAENMTCALVKTLTHYNIGKAFYDRHPDQLVPEFEEVVAIGKALQSYDD